MRIHDLRAVVLKPYDRRNAPVIAYQVDEHILIVPCSLRASVGVHIPAHRLGFEPQPLIDPALDKHTLSVPQDDVVFFRPFRRVKHPLPLSVGGRKADTRRCKAHFPVVRNAVKLTERYFYSFCAHISPHDRECGRIIVLLPLPGVPEGNPQYYYIMLFRHFNIV